jgi:hypothetical protein
MTIASKMVWAYRRSQEKTATRKSIADFLMQVITASSFSDPTR